MIDIELLLKEIDNHKVISFDVYDTLLLRPFVLPSDMYDYIEEKYKIEGFANARKNVIVKNKKEKTIEDIYSYIGEKYKQYLDLELLEERILTYKNEVIKKAFDYAVEKQKHIVLISDIYFHEEFLKNVLLDNGYIGFDKLYCSCDYQMNKCSGELFEYVLDDLNIEETEMLHIGDNEVSDFAVPKSIGISAFLIEQNYKQYCTYRKYLQEHCSNYWDSFITKICADNFSSIEKNFVEKDYCWYRFGYDIAGPLCWTFAKWLKKTVNENNSITDLAFVARDGYLVKKMYDQMEECRNVKTHYIYAPRILTTLLQESYENLDDIQELDEEEKNAVNLVYELSGKGDDERKEYISEIISKYEMYLASEEFGTGVIGVVDSSTNNLSSQKLVSNFTNNKTCGLYWFATEYAFSKNYELKTCQHEHYIVVESVDLFELIFKSPESTIKRFTPEGKVEFYEPSESECNRISNFKFIEVGAMDFYKDAENKNMKGFPDASIINEYLIRYCENPQPNEQKIIEEGYSSGGIANDIWIPTKVFYNKPKKLSMKTIKREMKRSLIKKHPKLFISLRKMYHYLKNRFA